MHEATSTAQMTLPFGANGGSAYPSDEEILGITPEGDASRTAGGPPAEMPDGWPDAGATRSAGLQPALGVDATDGERRRAAGATNDGVIPSPGLAGTRNLSDDSAAAMPEWLRPLLADPRAGTEARALWQEQQGYRALFPGGAQEAQQAVARAQQLHALDGAYFNSDARAQAGLAESLYRDDPRAFGNMLSAGARVLAARDPDAFRAFVAAAITGDGAGSAPSFGASVIPSPSLGPALSASEGLGMNSARNLSGGIPRPGETGTRNDSVGTAARGDAAMARQQAQVTRERAEMDWRRGEFAAEQYVAFQERANDAVVAQVRQTIEQSLASALPSSVPENARRRIAEDIFSEINTTLQGDRELSRQVSALVKQWRFDDAAREQVVRMIYGRARALVAPVAKRIVGDWTASLVAANRARAEKQNAAARRADLVGGGGMETVPRRPLSPRDVDYSQLTDEQILSM